MQRTLRGSALAGLLLVSPLVGCETREILLEIPGLAEGTTQGIWLWRASAETGEYQRVCRIAFGELLPGTAGGAASLPYVQECGGPQPAVELETTVERVAADPSTLQVRLWYLRWEPPGTYKVSSYNEDGESALSDTTFPL